MHPRLTVDYGLRYEPFIPFDQKGGRHTTWVAGVQSTVVPDAPKGILFPGDPGLPSRLTKSDLNNFAPRLGVAWDVSGDAKTVVRGGYGIFYQQINGETTHAAEGPWRGTTQLRQGRIEDPFGSLGQTEPPPESPGRFGCSTISEFPGLRCSLYPVPIRIVYTDQDLRTSYTQHFSTSLQRQLTTNLAVEASTSAKSAASWLATTTSTRHPTSTRRSPVSLPRCRTWSSGYRSARGSSARSRGCSETSSGARITACS